MNVVLIHGKDGNPADGWYFWLRKEVEKKGLKFVAPELPNSADPRLEEWLEEINKIKPDEETILIGHSRGGLAILRWLEKLPEGKKVKKVVLVAANNPLIDRENTTKDTHGFYEKGALNFLKIKKHCDNFIVIHSKDDPWVKFKSGESNAKGLNAKFKIYENKKHFGRFMFPEVPELLDEVLS